MANRGSVDGREAWSAAEEESQAFSTPLATFDIPPRGPTLYIRTALKATIAVWNNINWVMASATSLDKAFA